MERSGERIIFSSWHRRDHLAVRRLCQRSPCAFTTISAVLTYWRRAELPPEELLIDVVDSPQTEPSQLLLPALIVTGRSFMIGEYKMLIVHTSIC